MKRYGTIAYRKEDKSFGPSIPLSGDESGGPWLDLFARYLAAKLEEDMKKERQDVQKEMAEAES